VAVVDGPALVLPAGVALDLGGVGKGAAADLVAAGMLARGASGACVALGGDVRVAGAGPGGDRWRVPVEHPLDETCDLLTLPLRDAAVVTSTTRYRRWVHRGREQHHLIDPRTGLPAARGVAAVVVTAPAAARAEALAKAALVRGVAAGLGLLDRAGVAAWIVTDDGRVLTSEHVEGVAA